MGIQASPSRRFYILLSNVPLRNERSWTLPLPAPGGGGLLSLQKADPPLVLAVRGHHVQVIGAPFPVRTEHDVATIRGPAGILVVSLVFRQLPWLRPVGVYAEYVEAALIHGCVCDPIQAGPCRRGIVVAIEGEPLLGPAGQVPHVNLGGARPIRDKGDLLAVRREAR